MVSNRNLLFQGAIFRCHVSFRECNHPWFISLITSQTRLWPIHILKDFSRALGRWTTCVQAPKVPWSKVAILREFFRDPQQWDPLYGKRDPYHSHIFRDSNMGVGLMSLSPIIWKCHGSWSTRSHICFIESHVGSWNSLQWSNEAICFDKK